MTQPTRILLIRHGLVYNPESILYGRLPGYRLSETGREQARAAGQVLKKKSLAALYCSPQQRAQETAGLIAEACNDLTVQVDERINEVNVPWQGKPLAEAAARNWDIYTGNQPPHEMPQDVFARTQDFIWEMRVKHAGQTIGAVTHGDIVGFTIFLALGLPLDVKAKHSLLAHGLPDEYPETASISTFTYQTTDPDEVPILDYLKPYD